MNLNWDEDAWNDYLYWQKQDKKILKKINALIKDTMRDPYNGIGKPEPLKYGKNCWSRRIDDLNRLVYKYERGFIIVISVRGHYDD